MFIGRGKEIYGGLNPENPLSDSLVPMVLKKIPGGERSFDLYSLMLNQRIIFMHEDVHDGMASIICASLLYLESEDPNQDIYMYINSPGGVVTAGLAIYDTMNYIKPDVSTIVMGQAASMGMFLLSGGAKGKRIALPSSRVMAHQVSGGSRGQILDMKTQYEEAERLNGYLLERIAVHCDQPLDVVKRDMDRDFWMSAHQAKEWGVVDEVLNRAEIEARNEEYRKKHGENKGGSVGH